MNLSKINLLTPQSLVAANNGGLAVTDVSSLTRGGKFLLTAKSSAGTSPTLAVKIQGSQARARAAELIGAGDTEVEHRTATDTAIKLAAAVTLTAGTLERVTLPLKKNGAVASGTLTLTIEADSTGDPSGTPLATATFAAADVDAEFENVEFVFAVPVDFVAGDYWIVLASDVTLSGSNNISWRASDVEAGGNASQFDVAWAADATLDLDFWADGYVFADISGLGYTGVTTTGSIQMLESALDGLAVVRPHVTIGGTNSPAFYVGACVIGTPEQL